MKKIAKKDLLIYVLATMVLGLSVLLLKTNLSVEIVKDLNNQSQGVDAPNSQVINLPSTEVIDEKEEVTEGEYHIRIQVKDKPGSISESLLKKKKLKGSQIENLDVLDEDLIEHFERKVAQNESADEDPRQPALADLPKEVDKMDKIKAGKIGQPVKEVEDF